MAKFSRRRNVIKKRKSIRNRNLKGRGTTDGFTREIQCINCNNIYKCRYFKCPCPNCGILNG